jgi:hypothetical protein
MEARILRKGLFGSTKMTRMGILSRFLASRYNTKEILVLMCIVIVSLIVDTSLNRTYQLNIGQSSVPHESLPTFVAIFIVYLITQYLILRFVKQKSEGISSKQRFHVKEMHCNYSAVCFGNNYCICDFADVITFILQYCYVNHNYYRKLFLSDHDDGFACSTFLFMV